MKKLKLAIAILILIPILIFSSHYYLQHATTSMSQILSKSETLVQQGKKKEALVLPRFEIQSGCLLKRSGVLLCR